MAMLEHSPSTTTNTNSEERGAVFTRPEVVDFILDLAGYQVAKPLHEQRILEPSSGHGEFLSAMIQRLLTSYRKQGGTPARAKRELAECVRAVEVDRDSFAQTRMRLVGQLRRHELPPATAEALADQWLVPGDFLRVELPGQFDYVIGNPPYVRQELIPDKLLAEYRRRYTTLYNRADLYVPFIERGLRLLSPQGKLGYICSDRWMKCAYGKPLRALVAQDYHLDVFVDMVDTPAFQSEVVAYPAITILSRQYPGRPTTTRIAKKPAIDASSLSELAHALTVQRPVHPPRISAVRELDRVVQNHQPWLFDGSEQLDLVRRLEAQFPSIEEAGCKVGIGVATGADRVFIRDYESLAVEPSRKLPLVMADDMRSGRIVWSGKGVLNPFERDGGVAELDKYPRFARYIHEHEGILKARNVAGRSGDKWYRTIDRIWHDLTKTPKLLIPDIKGDANVVFDKGEFYPHHNLYWVTSDTWDLKALQAVLRSNIARMFVASYCVKMAHGFLRFQAQYIRRIRLPQWDQVTSSQRLELKAAAASLEQAAIDRAAAAVYGLNHKVVQGNVRLNAATG